MEVRACYCCDRPCDLKNGSYKRQNRSRWRLRRVQRQWQRRSSSTTARCHHCEILHNRHQEAGHLHHHEDSCTTRNAQRSGRNSSWARRDRSSKLHCRCKQEHKSGARGSGHRHPGRLRCQRTRWSTFLWDPACCAWIDVERGSMNDGDRRGGGSRERTVCDTTKKMRFPSGHLFCMLGGRPRISVHSSAGRTASCKANNTLDAVGFAVHRRARQQTNQCVQCESQRHPKRFQIHLRTIFSTGC